MLKLNRIASQLGYKLLVHVSMQRFYLEVFNNFVWTDRFRNHHEAPLQQKSNDDLK